MECRRSFRPAFRPARGLAGRGAQHVRVGVLSHPVLPAHSCSNPAPTLPHVVGASASRRPRQVVASARGQVGGAVCCLAQRLHWMMWNPGWCGNKPWALLEGYPLTRRSRQFIPPTLRSQEMSGGGSMVTLSSLATVEDEQEAMQKINIIIKVRRAHRPATHVPAWLGGCDFSLEVLRPICRFFHESRAPSVLSASLASVASCDTVVKQRVVQTHAHRQKRAVAARSGPAAVAAAASLLERLQAQRQCLRSSRSLPLWSCS